MTQDIGIHLWDVARRSLLNASGGESGWSAVASPFAAPPFLAAAPQEAAPAAPEVQEAWASLAVLTQLTLLATALIVGHVLTVRRIEWLSEAAVALLLGVIVGAVARASSISATYLSWLSFKKEFFFIALLPSIIFEAGFSLQVKPFFRNIGAICTFAFLGTVISTAVIGCSLWLAGLVRLCLRLSLVESLMYGSIISATDPVTVLAVFQRLGANSDLYALVFGESVLNDAVCIVLYRTLKLFQGKPVTGHALLAGFLSFWTIFIGSMFIGVAVGFLASLALKSRLLRSQHTPLESCLCILFAFTSYMVGDGLQLSGIVAILFCGMVMAHYARPNLSKAARDRTLAFFRILATLSETFVFIYIGASLAGELAWDSGFTWSLIALLLLAIAGSRAAIVAVCARTVNYLRPVELRIPDEHKFMLWWSGLRGAIAFALSLEASEDLADEGKGRVLLTTSLLIVLVTVLVNGGASAYLLERLNLRTNSEGRLPGSLPSSRSLSLSTLQRPTEYDGDDSGQENEQLLADGGIRRATTAASEGTGSEAGDGAPVSLPEASASEGQELSSVATRFLKKKLQSSVRKVREANRQGLFTQLEAFDNRYLQKFFVGDGDDGDDEDEPQQASRFPSNDAEAGTAHGQNGHSAGPGPSPLGPPPGGRATRGVAAAPNPIAGGFGSVTPQTAAPDGRGTAPPSATDPGGPVFDPWGLQQRGAAGGSPPGRQGSEASASTSGAQRPGIVARVFGSPLNRLGELQAGDGGTDNPPGRPNSIEWVRGSGGTPTDQAGVHGVVHVAEGSGVATRGEGANVGPHLSVGPGQGFHESAAPEGGTVWVEVHDAPVTDMPPGSGLAVRVADDCGESEEQPPPVRD